MSIFYIPFSYLMKGCLYISGQSYLIALFFFALVIQLVLLPLAIKQQKSQIKLAKIKPKEMAIREKYKGRTDKITQQKMTMEIQEMYQQNGYNQFAGCLPLLIQLPIIFILFAIVRQPLTYAVSIDGFDIDAQSKAAIEYYDKEKELLIKEGFETEAEYNDYVSSIDSRKTKLENSATREMELAYLLLDGQDDVDSLVEEGKAKEELLTVFEATDFDAKDEKKYADLIPNFKIAGINLLDEPSWSGNPWLLLIPLLVFLSSFLQTKITRRFSGAATQTDANGKPIGGGLFMEVGMPLISAFFAFSFSAAVGVYWIWRTAIGIVQTIVLAKALPIPKVTEEDLAAARKEMKAKQKKKKVITIEVDEDDNSYDGMIVSGSSNSSGSSDPAQRTPRKIEMLSSDDEEEE